MWLTCESHEVRNILGCSGAISLHLPFRVLAGISRFQINETGFETAFQSKVLKKFRTLRLKPVSDSWKLVLKLVYTDKVLGNVASVKLRRNILGCSDPGEGDPFVKALFSRYRSKWLKSFGASHVLYIWSGDKLFYKNKLSLFSRNIALFCDRCRSTHDIRDYGAGNQAWQNSVDSWLPPKNPIFFSDQGYKAV